MACFSRNQFFALRPFGLDRRHRKEQRARKIALAADAGLGNGLFDRKVGEAIDIYVNNRLVARGEVVVVEDRLGVTMTEIIKDGDTAV